VTSLFPSYAKITKDMSLQSKPVFIGAPCMYTIFKNSVKISRRIHTIHTHPFNSPFSKTTWVGRYQKGKTNVDFTEARDSEWQWHQLGICKSAPRSRQITTPAPHHSVFTGRMPFLPPNQQRQSTECTIRYEMLF